jgi:hypothetical protein
MKRFAQIIVAGAVLFSAQSALADTCFYEELTPSLKTFSFTNVDKNFSEVARNRLLVLANAQPKSTSWMRSPFTATLTCFNEVDKAPTVLQKLEVYRDTRTNEFMVRTDGL